MQRKDYRLTQRIVMSLIASMVTMSLSAQVQSKRPSLVVGIMVDGLSQEYIDQLRSFFGTDGFNRLLKDGVIIQNANYGTSLDFTAATAMIYTGSAPSVNGIPCSVVYDSDKGKTYPILLDPSKIGNYTDETYSPAALSVSTLADEVKIDADGLNQVHSIAPNALEAIIMAGHASNSAFWINGISGKWATTTYYKDVPTIISSRNYKTPLSTRLNDISWQPSMDISKYPDVPEHRRTYPFRYTFPKKERDRYLMFKVSACVNDEVTSVATDYITSLSLGNHQGLVDMINIAYTLNPYPYSRTADNRVETMDSYIKLDRNLAQLFATIERTVGMDNALVFIAGTPSSTRSRRDDERWNIPYGEFSTRKAISLLNMYLIAKHGNGEWVKAIHNNHLYLNNKLIKEHNIDAAAMRSDVAQFVARMSGIASVYTIDDVIAGRAGETPEVMRRNLSIKYSGDVIFTITPGWSVVDSENNDLHNNIVTRVGSATAPVYILAPSTPAQKINYNVDARAIAPTVARILRIRSPNSAATPPLHF